ncbi:2OG-Fe(II) oxygenase [Emcibacter nanhaiensis]|uniref:2OG-Fe(II) oxygenase n=1 Tax=Emcibacter nanhaiensis TaxID=1505037 RepID=A0A501PQU6_9PROT|nr:2OG-Fe(II) oxygenase [Emcibacter nanhaiensis]
MPLSPRPGRGSSLEGGADQRLFEHIARELEDKGYCLYTGGLSDQLDYILAGQLPEFPARDFRPARIGREKTRQKNTSIRRDEISWITGERPAGRAWLDWADELRLYLNCRLFLGLTSFESHYARYGEGDFYRRHLDAFPGEANRVLSLVAYLNHDWAPGDGGEIILYPDAAAPVATAPAFGTLAIFLAEEMPHEVLPCRTERLSIAGWFRVRPLETPLL